MLSPGLKQAVSRGAKRSLFVAVPVGVWLLALGGGLMPASVWQPASLVIALILFILALPLSLVLRIDLMEDLGIVGPIPKLLLAALVVSANFSLLAALRYALGRWRRNEEQDAALQPGAQAIFKKKEEK